MVGKRCLRNMFSSMNGVESHTNNERESLDAARREEPRSCILAIKYGDICLKLGDTAKLGQLIKKRLKYVRRPKGLS